MSLTDVRRFMDKVRLVDGTTDEPCWEWIASKFAKGYGAFWAAGKTRRAHVWSYETFEGPIPAGLVIDHLCRNTSCVNPDHLEAVTPRENLMRGDTIAAANVAKGACPQGHDYDEANTYTYNGTRQCRACHAERERVRRAA